MNYKNDVEAIDAFVVKYKELNAEIGKVIVGQNDTVKNVLISIFCFVYSLKCFCYHVPFLRAFAISD